MAAPETPNSRKETYYDSILKDGDTGLIPNSREEMYLDAIDRDLDDIRAEVAKKSESIPLEYRGNKIYKDGVEIDFEGIKALMGDHDNDIDLHADNDTIMRITAFADDAIEFSTTYITGGKVYVDRVIINSDNDIKFDEIETGGGGKLYTTIGQNEDGAMTQKAVTTTLFSKSHTDTGDDITGKSVKIGYGTLTSAYYPVAIGNTAKATGEGSVAVGAGAEAATGAVAVGGYSSLTYGPKVGNSSIGIGNQVKTGTQSVAIGVATGDQNSNGSTSIGYAAKATATGSVAIGYRSSATQTGEFAIGTTSTAYGYNNTRYRLLTGVHNPVNAHDAANKDYVDNNIRYMHNIVVNNTTASGTWAYSFNVFVPMQTTVSMLSDIAVFLNSEKNSSVLPASGSYTEGNNVYIVTRIKPYSDSQVQVEMYKLSDGSLRTIETGAIEVTDVVF